MANPIYTENLLANKHSPLVTIVVCTYNGAKYLDEQFQSLVEQDYRPLEIVVVDDVSSDGTWGLLQDWQRRYPLLIEIYRNEVNLGYNKNFEKSILLAKGDFVCFCDQDDIWLPEKTSSLMQAFIDSPKATMSYCKTVAVENGHPKWSHQKLWNYFEGDDVRKLCLYSQFSGHTMMCKRVSLLKAIPFPVGIIYDWWVSFYLCAVGSIVFVNKTMVYHRIHDHNSTKGLAFTKSSIPIDYEKLLGCFLSIDGIKHQHREFLELFLDKIKLHNKRIVKNADLDLFRFIFINRRILFGHIRRNFPVFSQIKRAFRLSRTDFIGRGSQF